jgi:hypothetical protein
MDYPLKYIGQMSQTLQTRYKEHIQAIRNNNCNSGYSNHIFNTGRACGSITDTMKVIKIEKKGKHLNTQEKYHICKMSKDGLHMNNTYVVCSKSFRTIFFIFLTCLQLSGPYHL